MPDSTLLNFNQNVGGATEVGKYPDGASSYGALDIAGNVWEWVADWYGDDFYDYSSYENPAGPSSGGGRVLRGGSWSFGARFVRASYRFWSYPGSRDNIYGFRCSR